MSHKIAREGLIQRKFKSKEQYDKDEHSVEIHIGNQILLRDAMGAKPNFNLYGYGPLR